MNKADQLSEHVIDYIKMGSYEMNACLGIQQMPDGYALMLNPDRTHFFWLRYDGAESVISWDKWSAYRGAKNDSKKDLV